MTIRRLARVLASQWRLVALLLLVTIAAAGLTLLEPRQYMSTAMAAVQPAVLSPPRPEHPYEGMHLTNPMVNTEPGLVDAANLLIQSQKNDARSADPSSVTVSAENETAAGTPASPVVVITAAGPDPTTSRALAEHELESLAAVLAEAQERIPVPPPTLMTLQVVAAPVDGRPSYAVVARAALEVGGAVGVLALLLVFARDGLRPSASRPRSAAASDIP
jgi:hypothetical protein